MKRFMKPVHAAVLTVLLASTAVPANAQRLSDAIQVGEQSTSRAEQAQARINQLDDERSDMVREFTTLLQQRDAAELYVKQQGRLVESQKEELASLNEQLGRVEEIKAQMYPMMQDMISALNMFRAADLPFKDVNEDTGQDLRALRYENLEETLNTPDASAADQYRLIIEAFQKEIEYGNTIGAYSDEFVLPNGEQRAVDVFRYGRVALVYVSKDRNHVGRWNRETGGWEELPSSYKAEILNGVRMARKLTQPGVLAGPVTLLDAQ